MHRSAKAHALHLSHHIQRGPAYIFWTGSQNDFIKHYSVGWLIRTVSLKFATDINDLIIFLIIFSLI